MEKNKKIFLDEIACIA
jgi:hypothetical protein